MNAQTEDAEQISGYRSLSEYRNGVYACHAEAARLRAIPEFKDIDIKAQVAQLSNMRICTGIQVEGRWYFTIDAAQNAVFQAYCAKH